MSSYCPTAWSNQKSCVEEHKLIIQAKSKQKKPEVCLHEYFSNKLGAVDKMSVILIINVQLCSDSTCHIIFVILFLELFSFVGGKGLHITSKIIPTTMRMPLFMMLISNETAHLCSKIPLAIA